MAAKGKEVAKKTASDVAVYDYGEDAGAGFENQTQADITIPFIAVLQALSPQVKDPSDGGVEGAKQGMLHNSVTDELFDGKAGVLFVPAYTEHLFTEWVPRDAGGGFVGRHEVDSDIVKAAKSASTEFGKYTTESGNQLAETFYVYGVLCPEGAALEPIVLGFTSTKIKVYRKWNTRLQMFTVPTKDGGKLQPPMFAHLTRLGTVADSNTKGDFFNFTLTPAQGEVKSSLIAPNDERFMAAKDLRDMVRGGQAKAAEETQTSAATDTPSDNAGGDGGEVPF
jgi:hypothetical protein